MISQQSEEENARKAEMLKQINKKRLDDAIAKRRKKRIDEISYDDNLVVMEPDGSYSRRLFVHSYPYEFSPGATSKERTLQPIINIMKLLFYSTGRVGFRRDKVMVMTNTLSKAMTLTYRI